MKILYCFLPVVALCAITLIGCGGSGWALSKLSPTDIVPDFAEYKFETDKPINDSFHAKFVFKIAKDPGSGNPVLSFSADGVRFDTIPVEKGVFCYTWGELVGGKPNYPSDSYSISGSFIKKDRAEGSIKLAHSGQMTAQATFVATATVTTGCGGSGWELDQYDPTDIVPDYAEYKFVTDNAINDSGHARFVFKIEKDPGSGNPMLSFSADGYRFDTIPIVRGTFCFAWGELGGDRPNHPTDSYGISGSVKAKDRVEGTVKLAYGGNVTAQATFIATLEPPVETPKNSE